MKKIALPNNVFGRLIAQVLESKDYQTELLASQSLMQTVLTNSVDAGFVPSLELIKYNDEVVTSGTIGISFEEGCSHLFLYFNNSTSLNEITLVGDVSVNEAILVKTLIKEKYDVETTLSLAPSYSSAQMNSVVAGDFNFSLGIMDFGIDLVEQIVDEIELPYLAYVFVSKDEDLLKEMNRNLVNITEEVRDKAESYIQSLSLREEVKDYLLTAIDSLVIDLDEGDNEGLKALLRIPYFHGMVEEITEVKLIN